MNSICLSVAPNLRCQGLSRIENIILAVPPVVEVFFSLTLAFTNSSIRGRKRWLLVCDGLSFFLLTIADALAHLLPQISSSESIFTIFDFVIAGASFVPILAYTLFLVLFSRANLVTYIPSRFSRVIIITLFILIPFIIASNELGSLLGISHGTFQFTNLTPVFGIKFLNLTFSRIASFFGFVAVTLLTLFQAANFVLSFVRVIRALSDARRAEGTSTQTSGPEEVHLFRGLGWVCAGLKLGAIETVVGFADINFEVAITRRALRLFARGALIIGVIKGMNIVEDFGRWKAMNEESQIATDSDTSQEILEKPVERSRIAPNMISLPRNSTFYQMSPTATQFHAAQSQKKIRKPGPSPLVLGAESSFNRFKDLESAPASVASRSRVGERVTVRYDGETPPVLDVRFSGLSFNIPSLPKMPEKAYLATVVEDPHEDPTSAQGVSPAPGIRPAMIPQTAPAPGLRTSVYGAPLFKSVSAMGAANSYGATRDFSNLPPRLRPGQPVPSGHDLKRNLNAEWRMTAEARSIQNKPTVTARAAETGSQENSLRRQPAPSANTAMPSSPASTVPSDYGPDMDIEYEQPRKAPTPPISHPSMFSPTSSEEGTFSGELTPQAIPPLTRASTVEASAPETPASAAVLSGPLLERKIKQRARASQAFTFVSPLSPPRVETLPQRRQRRLSEMRQQLQIMPMPEEDRPLELREQKVERGMGGWLRNNGPLYELQAMGRPTDNVEDDEAIIDEAWQRAGLSRIKSVTRVPVHTTPHVQQTFDVRSSLIAEEDDLDILGLPSSYDNRRESVIMASLRRPARSDSGVFSEEDRRWVRQSVYRR